MRHIILVSLILAAACDSGSGGSFDFGETESCIDEPNCIEEPAAPARAPRPRVECEAETIVVDAAYAQIIPPMELGSSYSATSDGADLTGYFAASTVPGEGLAVFSFETECPGSFQISARVRDTSPGRHLDRDDPDTFYVQIDDEPEGLWEYGCQATGEGITWSWLDVRQWDGACQAASTWDFAVHPSGEHFITFRSAEAYQGMKWAAVAAVEITFTPQTEG